MKIVSIKPVIAYAHGRRFVSTLLNVESINDDLFDSVHFKHILFNESGEQMGEALAKYEYTQAEAGQSKVITVSDDQSFVTCEWDNSAEGAYQIVAQSFGFEIVTLGSASQIAFSEI